MCGVPGPGEMPLAAQSSSLGTQHVEAKGKIAAWEGIHFIQIIAPNSKIYGTYFWESARQLSDACLVPAPLGPPADIVIA